MKKIVPKTISMLTFVLFLNYNIKAQGVFFANYVFHNWIATTHPAAVFPDNSIDVTNPTIVNETSIDCNHLEIDNFDGLQYFPSLRYLDVSYNWYSINYIGSPLFPAGAYTNSLKIFKCRGCRYTNFPFFPNLEYLDCASGYNTDAGQNVPPAFPSTLKYLDCSYNSLYGYISFPAGLDTLICANNAQFMGPDFYTGIKGINTTFTSLKYLDCSGNILYGLPSLPASLTYLDCSDNTESYGGASPQTVGGISALPPLGPNIRFLKCGGNYISALPALPASLRSLNTWGNYITSLPVLPDSLYYLEMSGNNLSSLPALPDSLQFLGLYNIPNLHCLPHLPALLSTLNTTNSGIKCVPNTVNGLTTTLPLCTLTNNSYLCISAPVLSGHVFYDYNSNGIKDPLESYCPNVAIQLSNGLETYSNTNGFYNVTADTGVNTLTVVNPPHYYDAIPAIANFNMPTFSSVASRDIALQPNTFFDSIAVYVTPLSAPHPGGGLSYEVYFENVGTTSVSPSTVLHFNNTMLSFYYADLPVTVSSNNISYTSSSLLPGQHGSYIVTFIISPTVQIGQEIVVSVTATAGTATATDSYTSIVTGSFDPNDKNATPTLTPEQVASGAYIDYLIRFQNTGNDTAYNIIVTDTLNGQLDASSLQVIKTSHPCKVTRNGSKLSFEFLNIFLPDKNTNEPASHGYIRFRVKPQSTVVVNDIVPNKANIYFDFNAGVLTNTANTLIQLSTVPLHLLSFKAFANNNKEALLYWNTENEFNTSFFVIEQSTDGSNFNSIGTTTARGQGNNSYNYRTALPPGIVYYRLKIIDIDGKFALSQVIQLRSDVHFESIVLLGNPVNNSLNLSVNDRLLVNRMANIINEQGGIVKRIVLGDGLQHVDVSDLSTGMYYLKCGAVVKKIIIKH